jgi:hypothetical protein
MYIDSLNRKLFSLELALTSGFSKGLQGWGELLPEDKKYATDSFVDPESGRTTVDVSDLGISMGDLGKKGWNSPENVHPQVKYAPARPLSNLGVRSQNNRSKIHLTP